VLEGEVINAALPEQVSAGVLPGVIQLPPSGLPLILSTDAQTIGGYPIVGAVIAADLRWMAQLQPGSTVRLQPVSLAQARTLAIKARAQFNAALYAIADKQNPHALD
jgi:5-oxoprolinase (ATP-hydrolysing) subunit C